MAYNETYTADDVPAIVIDLLGGVGVIFVGLAGLVGLLLVWNYFKTGKVKL